MPAAPYPPRPSFWASPNRGLWVSLFIALGLSLIYCQMFGFEFITYDTGDFVLKNRLINGGLTLRGLREIFSDSTEGYYIPLTGISHMLDFEIFGMRPWGHLFVNLALHIANSLLLLLALRRLTGSFWRSAAVALIFAFHPQRVESVAWVAERKDVLSAFFWMLTLLAYERYARAPFSFARYGLVLLTLGLGLLSKPSVVTLPCLLLLLDFWPLKRFNPQGIPHLILEKVPMFLMVLVWSILTFHAQQAVLIKIPMAARLFSIPLHYVQYLQKTFWPVSLSVLYISEPKIPPSWNIGASLFIAALSLAALLNWRRRPYLITGWFWFLGVLVPMIDVVQNFIPPMADHHTYISQIGLSIIVVWGLANLAGRFKASPPPLACAGGFFVALLMLLSAHQLSYWHDDVALWKHAVSIPPADGFKYNNLGAAYEKKGDYPQALKYAQLAVQSNPNYLFLENLGQAENRMGNAEAALAAYDAAFEKHPTDHTLPIRMGEILAQLRRFDESIAKYETALKMNPSDPQVYTGLGFAYSAKSDWAHAAAYYRQALKLDPRRFTAAFNLGMIAKNQGDAPAAEQAFTQAAELDPRDPRPPYQLGLLWSARGETARATTAFQSALTLARAAGNQLFAEEIQKKLAK